MDKHNTDELLKLFYFSRMAAMDETLRKVTHQLKQPLNIISLLTETLQMDFEDGELTAETMNESASMLMSEVSYLSNTLTSIRNFYRRSGAETFSVLDAVYSVITVESASFKNNNINILLRYKDCEMGLEEIIKSSKTLESSELCSYINDAELSIYGEKTDFMQAVSALLVNAKEAVLCKRVKDSSLQYEAGLVKITLEDATDEIMLTLSDTGCGMNDETLADAFKPYFTTKETEGSGLGLFICDLVIRDGLKGKVELSNTAVGVSAVIRIPKQ